MSSVTTDEYITF